MPRINEVKVERDRVEADRVERAVHVSDIAGKGVDLCGHVKSVVVRESDWGYSLKMLFEDDRGFRLWGTMPSAMRTLLEDGDVMEFVVAGDIAGKGVDICGHVKRDVDGSWELTGSPRVEFVANVSATDDDDLFGFFSRPRRAEFAPGTEEE